VILVDTSVWIELLAGRAERPMDDRLAQFVTCGPIVQEVLQGLRTGRDSVAFQESFLALPCLSDPMPLSLFWTPLRSIAKGAARGTQYVQRLPV
jgi:hypothetical protein